MEHNGPGLEYKVSYRRRDVEEEWQEQIVKRHSFVVKNTPTFVPYEIKIQAKNHAGWAPEPETIVASSGEDCKYMALFFFSFVHMGINTNKFYSIYFVCIFYFIFFYKKGEVYKRVSISVFFFK